MKIEEKQSTLAEATLFGEKFYIFSQFMQKRSISLFLQRDLAIYRQQCWQSATCFLLDTQHVNNPMKVMPCYYSNDLAYFDLSYNDDDECPVLSDIYKKWSEQEKAQMSDLNAKYYRLCPDYLIKILIDIKNVEGQLEVILNNLYGLQQNTNHDVRQIRCAEMHATPQQLANNGERLESKKKFYKERLAFFIPKYEDEHAELNRIQEDVFVSIYWEWRNFERAKQEDQRLSEELASVTVEEVKAIANLRFRRCIEEIQSIRSYDQRRLDEWKELGI